MPAYGRVEKLIREIPEGFRRTVNTDTIRLAVTGLSRAGKTVFITSAITNLLAQAHGFSVLPALMSGGIRDRLLSIEIVPASVEAVPIFAFKENLGLLAAASPHWPKRTSDISEITLKLRLERTNQILRKVLGTQYEVELVILDYPGEWLLDLPMLDLAYADWSNETLAAMEKGLRSEASKEFRDFLKGCDQNEPATEDLARTGHDSYRRYLNICREKYRLRFLQPGRCLCPGPWGDVPLMWFYPLPTNGQSRPGSLFALMEARFEAYKADVRERFFDKYFSQFNRQIVLVDVLGALQSGEEAFRDTYTAVNRITDAFRHSGSWLGKIAGHQIARKITEHQIDKLMVAAITGDQIARKITGHRIDKVMIAATKADHVPERQREALHQLLCSMTSAGIDAMKEKNVAVEVCAIASIVCTEDDTHVIDGRAVQVVKGLPLGKDRLVKFWPGDVPLRSPDSDFWAGAFFEMPVFQAPKINPTGVTGIPHYGLDKALKFLIGDVL